MASLISPSYITAILLLGATTYFTFISPYRGPLYAVHFAAMCLLPFFWESQVSKIVPEPYLDEVFHIPQAQAYCRGEWTTWDPKLTTPPGLYIISTIFLRLTGSSCSVSSLRAVNKLTLVIIGILCTSIYSLLHTPSSPSSHKPSKPSTQNIHTCLNILLFPPLFFFSALYYTDILSTFFVLLTYYLFLSKRNPVLIYGAGIASLGMRQTNVFWVGVFFGGLEFVRTLKELRGQPEEIDREKEREVEDVKSWVLRRYEQLKRGEIHDLPLRDAGVEDFIQTPLSLLSSLPNLPLSTVTTLPVNLSPYILILISFAAFIYLNGGVVLGDKSNHVATLHLPQLFYFSSFITFFSFPILLPSAFTLLQSFLFAPLELVISSASSDPPSSNSRGKLIRRIVNGILWGMGGLATVVIIHYNTIIHPFTLADNRHYVFYVFRYTILRHPLIKYLLAPIYLFSFYLSYQALAGNSVSAPANRQPPKNKTTPSPKPSHKKKDAERPPTSFFLIFALTTALSLITAPLVEPRYFILPWVFWRLHIPASPSPSPSTSTSTSTSPSPPSQPKPKTKPTHQNPPKNTLLWLETIWFLAINGVTGYIFLYRGFEWKQEGGVVQRFMW